MLIDQVKTQMMQAMRDKDTPRRDVLRVALGDLQTEASRGSEPLPDAKAQGIIRKMMKSNDETLAVIRDDPAKAEQRQRLEHENVILGELLPQTLSVDAIVEKLQPVADDIKAAGNDGQATGVAMKHLKPQGVQVEGKDVAAAVKRMRGA